MSESFSVVSYSLWSHGLYSPWNSSRQNTGVGSLSLLQGIFLTQGLNPGLPHCRWILYQLSHNQWLLLLLLLSRFRRVRLCATPCQQPTRFSSPWDSPGKNTGGGCHFLLQCVKVKSESEVAQSCQTCSDRMDCSLPGSSTHGIFQARVLEWGAIAFSDSQWQVTVILLPIFF